MTTTQQPQPKPKPPTTTQSDQCGHGLPISGPNGEFVQCDACDAGNAEADLLR